MKTLWELYAEVGQNIYKYAFTFRNCAFVAPTTLFKVGGIRVDNLEKKPVALNVKVLLGKGADVSVTKEDTTPIVVEWVVEE